MRASLEYVASLESQLADAKAKPAAKGDEMTCIHDWDYSPDSADTLFTCLKCGTELYAVDSFNRLNMLEHYAAQFRKEGDEYRAQLASRDALIERLIEVGEFFSGGFEHDAFGVLANGNWFEGCDEGTVRGREFLEEIQSRLHAIVAEWQAMKEKTK